MNDGEGEQMTEAFCRWYERPFRDVAEWQQSQCKENGQSCEDCPDLIIKEDKQEE